MNDKEIVSVIGGSGFIGRYLVDRLLDLGYYVKVISRETGSKKLFFPSSKLGQYSLVNCNVIDFEILNKVIKDSTIVINLVGVLVSNKKNSFEDAHVKGARNLVKACLKNNVEKLIHISALGISNKNNSEYSKTKIEAEKYIKSFGSSVIIRPSVVCGEEDNFINFFAKQVKLSPIIPLIGSGSTKFQPIFIADLVEIIILSLKVKLKKNLILDVGGPDVLSFKDILDFISKELEVKRLYLDVSFGSASKLAYLLEKLTTKILTVDQVKMLKFDSVINSKSSFKKYLNHEPNSFYIFAKNILKKYKLKGGHLS
ncbi:MAG: hypothetical protein CMP40_02335 [Rickettsiales bacterium]|nr:hypothetical protein [Rickettsiales bacterium]